MAGHPPPEGIGDDFFEQIFSMPSAYGGGSGGGGGGAEGSLSGMVLQLSSRDGGAQVGSSSAAAVPGGGLHGAGMFPLGLSLDQGKGAAVYGKSDEFREDHAAGNVSSSKSVGDLPFSFTPFSFEMMKLIWWDLQEIEARMGNAFPRFAQVAAAPADQLPFIRGAAPPQPQQVFHAQPAGGAVAAAQHPPAPRPRVRARRGQATDPHSIAERLRRERIAERIRALQELVPNTNKTDRAAMLDEIMDYVKFLRLQVKVLSMSRLGGASAVAQLVADIPLPSAEGEAGEGGSSQQVWEKWSSDGTEQQVAKLMEEDVGAAMQFLQSKALCIMPISLAATIYQTHHHQHESPASIKPEPSAPP